MFTFNKNKNKNKLEQNEAKKQIDSGENIVIIDVRDENEFARGHIENAINIPLTALSAEIEKVVPNKEQKIFVNCLSGGRSKIATSDISSKGYTKVFDIGGINSWEYEITK